MRNRRVLSGLGALVAGLLFWTSGLVAQSKVTIVGTVVDEALKPIAGATVTLTQADKSLASAKTDAAGAFKFAGVLPGAYKVKAEIAAASGTAARSIVRDLTVPAGVSTIRLPLVLAASKVEASRADAAEQIQVTAGSATARAAGGAGGGGGGRGGVAGGVMATPPPPPSVVPSQAYGVVIDGNRAYPGYPGETYSTFEPNRFHNTMDRPLSTFGADVDTASYSNIRRFLSGGQLPPREAVRIEELLNYFRFTYQSPRDGHPIGLTTEIGPCPWAPSHRLVLVGARAVTPAPREITGRNIVLLLDVSGSMAPAERLPMIKTAMGMFVDTLKPNDTLAIVTYAGTSGVALLPTPARQRETIQHAIASLQAGGSTNGASGLLLAYRIARESFVPGGVNRVLLATDGDFNVGITSQRDLLSLIERERESGVFLSVLGVGSGNLKDATMEMLADRGNGNYSYLDSLAEARRVLIHEGDATLETVAKDVKFQVEFNPAVVQAWKLLGYENRALAAQDFNNDRKDAGEVGAGHTVTVLYEVIPVGVERTAADRADERSSVDALRYQTGPVAPPRPTPRPVPTDSTNGEWLTVKTRYKLPEEDTSRLITRPVRETPASDHLALASAVAEFGLILRDAPHDLARWDALAARVTRLRGRESQTADINGFRELVETARSLARLRR